MASFCVFPKLPGMLYPSEGRVRLERSEHCVQELLCKGPAECVFPALPFSWDFCHLNLLS